MLSDTLLPVGIPNWVDVTVPDQEKGKTFYGELFGWTFLGGGDAAAPYFLCQLDGQDVAGLGKSPEGIEGGTYFAVEETDTIAAKAEEAGGKVVVPETEVGEYGTFVILSDPAGGGFGLWKPNKLIGCVTNVPGAVRWIEYWAHDIDAAKSFYGAVLGHTYEDLGGPNSYHTIAVGGETVAGMCQFAADVPREVQPHWIPCFATANVDDGLARIVELGGTVIEPAMDTPFGRVAAVTDNQGVPFKLCDPPDGRPADMSGPCRVGRDPVIGDQGYFGSSSKVMTTLTSPGSAVSASR